MWSLRTGEPVIPIEGATPRAWKSKSGSNPLARTFTQMPRVISARDDGGLDVVEKGTVLRFGVEGRRVVEDGAMEEDMSDDDDDEMH